MDARSSLDSRLIMQGQNIDSRINRLSSIPIRKLRVEHSVLRAKQQVLSRFLHLRRQESARGQSMKEHHELLQTQSVPQTQPPAQSTSYSIKLIGRQKHEQIIPVCESKQQLKGRSFKINLAISQTAIQKKRCDCLQCDECSKRDFPSFLKMFVEDDSIPPISAKSWCLWRRERGKYTYIYGKRPYKQREVASLTKIMTALVINQKMLRWQMTASNINITVPEYMKDIKGTTAGLQPGECYSVEQLLYGLMLPSGNDAALLLSEIFGYMMQLEFRKKLKLLDVSQPDAFDRHLTSGKTYVHNFIQAMNEKCRQLGLANTVFFNAHGNDAFDTQTNTSTALEMGKASFSLLESSCLSNIVSTKQYNGWTNTNKLLWEGFNGIKTGVNEVAGPCLAAAYKDLVIVILNSKSMEERWIEVKRLVRWASLRRTTVG